jgi:hypothetical protein
MASPVRTLPDLICPVCSTVFYRRPAKRRVVNYCSPKCASAARLGERCAPASEFGARPPHNKLPVGSVRIRNRPKRSDGPRTWVKVAEPNVWRLRAIVNWEAVHGPVPAGLVVHHVSRDTLDDRVENLEAIDRATHLREHRPEFEAKRAARASAARWA